MENLGEKLKQARLAKNLSIEEIHKITKINRNYIAALETSNVKAFPAEVYYKNFLKRYASYLGLNGEQILQEYNDNKKQQENKVVNKKIVSKEKSVRNKKDFFIPIVFVILIILLILMNYFIKTDATKTEQEIDNLINADNIYDKQKDDKKIKEEDKIVFEEQKQPVETEKNTVQQKVEIVKIKNQYSFKSTDRLGGGSFGQIYKGINLKTKDEDIQKTQQEQQVAPASAPVPVPAATTPSPRVPDQKLVIKAINDTWIDVYADGKRKYTGYIFAGKQNSFYANEVFNIKIGDVTGIEVFFNDVQVNISSGAAENNVNSLELKKENE